MIKVHKNANEVEIFYTLFADATGIHLMLRIQK